MLAELHAFVKGDLLKGLSDLAAILSEVNAKLNQLLSQPAVQADLHLAEDDILKLAQAVKSVLEAPVEAQAAVDASVASEAENQPVA